MTPEDHGQAAKSASQLVWTDSDGDRVRFSDSREAIGNEPVLCSIEILDGEGRGEMAVYVGEDDARRLIAWLAERLAAR